MISSVLVNGTARLPKTFHVQQRFHSSIVTFVASLCQAETVQLLRHREQRLGLGGCHTPREVRDGSGQDVCGPRGARTQRRAISTRRRRLKLRQRNGHAASFIAPPTSLQISTSDSERRAAFRRSDVWPLCVLAQATFFCLLF